MSAVIDNRPVMLKQDLSGQSFGCYRVKSFSRRVLHKGRLWLCECICGTDREIDETRLSVRPDRCSCGRFFKVNAPSEKVAYAAMIDRCSDPKSFAYHRYGGRGIAVCERWRASFYAFYLDMGPKPSPDHTIDRHPNNDGDYEPTNCRWATMKEQCRNRSTNRIIECGGVSRTLAEWAELSGVGRSTIELRIARGVPIHDAIFLPPLADRKEAVRDEDRVSSDGDAARAYRIALGFTMGDVAKRVGVSASTVHSIEHSCSVTLGTIRRFSLFFGCDPSKLILARSEAAP